MHGLDTDEVADTNSLHSALQAVEILFALHMQICVLNCPLHIATAGLQLLSCYKTSKIHALFYIVASFLQSICISDDTCSPTSSEVFIHKLVGHFHTIA